MNPVILMILSWKCRAAQHCVEPCERVRIETCERTHRGYTHSCLGLLTWIKLPSQGYVYLKYRLLKYGVKMEPTRKLIWKQGERNAKVHFSIPYVGELNLDVYSKLPGAGNREPLTEQKELARRHIELLVRNLIKSLDSNGKIGRAHV